MAPRERRARSETLTAGEEAEGEEEDGAAESAHGSGLRGAASNY